MQARATDVKGISLWMANILTGQDATALDDQSTILVRSFGPGMSSGTTVFGCLP